MSTKKSPTPLPSVAERLFPEQEERDFADVVRRFLTDHADANEQDYRSGKLDAHDLWREAAKAGLLGLSVPEEYGGAGAGPITNAIVSYQTGKSLSYGTLGSTITSDAIGYMVFEGATEELKHELAPRILAGEIQTLAMTEPDAGTNSAGMTTYATVDGSDFILNGNKAYISHGDVADIIYVVAKTDRSAGWEGISVFAVEGSWPGVERRRIDITSQSAMGLGAIFFEDVRIPRSRLIGEVGGARTLVAPTVVLDRMQIAARALAQAELALSLSIAHTKTRQVEGRLPLFDYQHTQMKLADMHVEVETATELVAAGLRQLRAETLKQRTAAVAKIFATDMSARVLDHAVQLFGAAGVAQEYPIAGMYAANRVFRILGGTSELLKMSLARAL